MYSQYVPVRRTVKCLAVILPVLVLMAFILPALGSSPVGAQELLYIKGIEPSQGRCGDELDLVVYGGGFDSSTGVAFYVNGIEVLYVEFINPSELGVGIWIANDAPAGRWPVAVSSPGGGEYVLEGAFTIICPAPGGDTTPPPDDGGRAGQPPPPPDDGGREGQPPRPDGGDNWWLILIIILGVVGVIGVGAVGLGLTLRYSAKMRRRKEWERKAQEKEPPRPCQVNSWYCEKEVGVELKRSKLTELGLAATSPSASQSKILKGHVAGDLDRAIVAYRLREQPEAFQNRIGAVAQELAQQIIDWLQGETSGQELSLEARFEGAEMTLKFTLMRCVQKGPMTDWQKVDEWEVSYQSERDEPIGTLYLHNPSEAGMVYRIAPDLVNLLARFIERL